MTPDDRHHLLSRMLPAFGFGIMVTFLVCRHGWWASTPIQRGVFGLGAVCVIAGLVLDLLRRRPDAETHPDKISRGANADGDAR